MAASWFKRVLAPARQHFGRSVVALGVKLATAALLYAMFVVLSRSMDVAEYGRFAFGFSLATMLAILAGSGQHMTILRLWPEYVAKGDKNAAASALSAGWVLTLIAGLLTSALLALVTLVLDGAGAGVSYLYGAALLVLPLAAAEYFSAALRAQGSVIAALTPRDILWRVSVPVIAWIIYLSGGQLSGFAALSMVAALLVLALFIQAIAARGRYRSGIGARGFAAFALRHRGMIIWVWLATLLDTAALNLDVVLVGALLGPESSGLFLNAFRTAGLMTLFLFAINQVSAPVFSRHFHSGALGEAQNVVNFAAWGGFVFALGVFAVFGLAGPLVMGLFGPEYAAGAPVLMVLAAGLLVDAATGPTRIVMMMAGHERAYVAVIAATGAAALIAALLVIPVFGVMGAALVNMAARIVTQAVLVTRTRQLCGIDPSILGAVLKPAGKVARG